MIPALINLSNQNIRLFQALEISVFIPLYSLLVQRKPDLRTDYARALKEFLEDNRDQEPIANNLINNFDLQWAFAHSYESGIYAAAFIFEALKEKTLENYASLAKSIVQNSTDVKFIRGVFQYVRDCFPEEQGKFDDVNSIVDTVANYGGVAKSAIELVNRYIKQDLIETDFVAHWCSNAVSH